jgi:4-amino-4-deoxy-L-arabinose transferase-like glycosyltransferase
MRSKTSLAVFLVALLLRVGFVLWAPGEPTGDGFFYHVHAVDLAEGNGYVNVDRSPANTWMPGWPAFVAALYWVVGPEPRALMLVNALLGALTAVLLMRFGQGLLGARIGTLAGGLYAVWPGLIYYSATLFNETLFSFLLIVLLNLAQEATRRDRGRPALFAATGLVLGLCALVKAEPLVLAAGLAAYFWVVRRSVGGFLREAALCLGLAVLVVVPWTIRNWVVFDRFIPTSAGGGTVVAAANHSGASGGNDLVFLLDYAKRLGVADATQAEQNIAINDRAWRDACAFARENPGEQLSIVANKLRLTYMGDSGGADLVRGFFGRDNWHLSEASWRRLSLISNVWWWIMAVPFTLGLIRLRTWPLEARVLVLGLVGTWLLLHAVFMGGMRFHVPELLLHTLVVGTGLDWMLERLGFANAPVS